MEAWTFHDTQPATGEGRATPLVFWLEWSHQPDDVLGNVCIECLNAWPCQSIRMLRAVVISTMNLPIEEMLAWAKDNLENAADRLEAERVRAEAHGSGPLPVNFGAQRRKRAKLPEDVE